MYQFIDGHNEFCVLKRSTLDDTGSAGFKVVLSDYGLEVEDLNNKFNHKSFGIIEYMSLINYLVDIIYFSEPVINNNVRKSHRGKLTKKFKILQWAKNKTKISLNYNIWPRIQYFMSKLDNKIVLTQRRIFNALGPKRFSNNRYLFLNKELYNNHYLVKDINQYLIAAMSMAYAFLDTRGLYFSTNYSSSRLNNWYDIFNPRTKFVNLTLYNIKQPIRSDLIPGISNFDRPIFSKIELLFTLLAKQHYLDINYKPMHMATKNDIFKVANLYKKAGYACDLRKTSCISNLVAFLMDYPDTHNGSVVGLFHKSLNWHRTRGWGRASHKFPLGTKTKQPMIELPKQKEIIFCDTVDSIVEEGNQMGHCVSSYADRAVNGDCFIFSVNRKKQRATVEVGPDGYVRQSKGPHNCENETSKWAKNILSKWAEGLKALKQKPQLVEDDTSLLF